MRPVHAPTKSDPIQHRVSSMTEMDGKIGRDKRRKPKCAVSHFWSQVRSENINKLWIEGMPLSCVMLSGRFRRRVAESVLI